MDFNFAVLWGYGWTLVFLAAALTCIWFGIKLPVRDTSHAFAFGGFCALIIFGPLIWATLSR